MKKSVAVLLFYLVVILVLALQLARGAMPPWMVRYELTFKVSLAGALGGCLYCLRAVYLNACVKKNWDPDWEVWYFIRPIASAISAYLSSLVLKAGLVVLEASRTPEAGSYGFIALAFIAGMNVDKFIEKTEDIAQSIWGIGKSRVSARATESEAAPKL